MESKILSYGETCINKNAFHKTKTSTILTKQTLMK